MAITDAMVALYSTTLASSTSSVSIVGLPASGYRDLRIIINATANSGYNVPVAFNGDTTAGNYPSLYLGGDGSSASSGTLNNYIGGVYGSNLSITTIDIFDYATTDRHKTWLSRLSVSTNAASLITGRWANAAAITSIAFTIPGTWAAGSTFSVFGIKA